ncbi:hypothetical protein FDG2_3337 [Candidatus Protofrankia californiensis]|uniref:Mutator family transposase n=1 Tax=Candidatus Protofrankia californiensis TaxID=1839754 RepID=A0A1C3NZD6_9ACTN|nr:hypothetical protein FDG2_3337 [Candidatus Protofrankia californiensis]
MQQCHRVYPVIFIDTVVVKVRDGQVVNRPVYAIVGVTVHGERDILGLWVEIIGDRDLWTAGLATTPF